MAISGVSGLSGQTGTSNTDSNTLSTNYEMFLTLLTTQLKVQDPLDPMKAEQFTDQLVQYSGIEQQIKMNANLETLIASVESSNASNLVAYIGTQVVADGVQSVLNDGEAIWEYDAGKGADSAKVTIRNSQGAEVFSETIDLSAGKGTYTWDGHTASGVDAPDGSYSISFAAKDADDNSVSVSTQSSGIVDGVDMTGSEPALRIGDILIPLSSVNSVRASL